MGEKLGCVCPLQTMVASREGYDGTELLNMIGNDRIQNSRSLWGAGNYQRENEHNYHKGSNELGLT